MAKRCRDLVRQTLGIALGRALPGQLLQGLLWRQVRIVALFRVLVGKLAEVERAAPDDLQRAGQRLGVAIEQAVHLGRGLEVAIGVALAPESQLVDCGVMPDGRHHVLKQAATGLVEEHVVGHDGRHPHGGGEVRQLVKAKLIVWPAAQGQRHIGAVAEGVPQPAKPEPAMLVGQVWDEDGDQSLAIGDEIVPFEMALALARASFAERQQAAKAGIGWPIGRIDEDRHAAGKIETASDDEAHAGRFRGVIGPNDPRQRVAIDDADRLDPHQRGRGEQLFGR